MLPLIREHLSVDEYRAFLKTARRNARRRSATIASHQVPSPAEMGQ